MDWCKISYKGERAWRCGHGALSATVLERGAKVQSLRWEGREFLWQSAGTDYRRSEYGDVFETGEFSGFDDMFPNISACFYPDGPWAGTRLPDHGEVWTQDWRCIPRPGALELKVGGVRLPYRLKKRVRVREDALILDYHASNPTNYPLKYLWAAHPLFVLEDGTRLELPGAEEIINANGGGRLGPYGAHHPWPVTADGLDLSALSPAHHTYSKYYVWNPLGRNLSRLCYPGGTTVSLAASPAKSVPYLGVWTDEDGYGGHHMACAAPEPCTAPMDGLDAAHLFGRESILPPGGSARWRLAIQFQKEAV